MSNMAKGRSTQRCRWMLIPTNRGPCQRWILPSVGTFRLCLPFLPFNPRLYCDIPTFAFNREPPASSSSAGEVIAWVLRPECRECRIHLSTERKTMKKNKKKKKKKLHDAGVEGIVCLAAFTISSRHTSTLHISKDMEKMEKTHNQWAPGTPSLPPARLANASGASRPANASDIRRIDTRPTTFEISNDRPRRPECKMRRPRPLRGPRQELSPHHPPKHQTQTLLRHPQMIPLLLSVSRCGGPFRIMGGVVRCDAHPRQKRGLCYTNNIKI